MSLLKQILLLSAFAGMAACHKPAAPAVSAITQVGVLELQGMTSYQYGTHLLVVNPYTSTVLKSSTINLQPYVGKRIKVIAQNTNTCVEGGPALYDVTVVSEE